jgi:hypothetical protein
MSEAAIYRRDFAMRHLRDRSSSVAQLQMTAHHTRDTASGHLYTIFL